MNKIPKLSIIISIYNKEPLLVRCLNSIKNQTFTDFECLMIDDGSIDNSAAICKKYEAVDKRFRYIYKENGGLSSTRNLGIELSKGKWLGFPDPDDYCEVSMYEKLLNNTDHADIVLCEMAYYDKTRIRNDKKFHIIPGHYNKDNQKVLSSGQYDIGFNTRGIFNSNLIKKSELRYIDSFCEDSIFVTALLNQSDKGLTIIPDILYNYFYYQGSLGHRIFDRTFILKSYKQIYPFIFRSKWFEDNEMLKRRLVDHLRKVLIRKYKSIDFVVPMVNPSKESFKKDFEKYSKLEGHYDPNRDSERYAYSDDLLKFMFRSIDKYMNWIGVLHIIVRNDDDIPEWLDKSKVNIIYHSDYIPSHHLPTFNSGTIESFMPNLLLSENFIFSNDDCIVLNDLKSTDFFDIDILINKNEKIPVYILEKTTLKFFESDETCKSFLKMLKLSLAHSKIKLLKMIGTNRYYKCRHIMCPLKLSRIKYLKLMNEKEINDSCTRFRSDKNIAYWYFAYDQAFNTPHIEKGFPYSYIGRRTDPKNIISLLDKNKYRAACINNMKGIENKIINILSNYFSEKCSYEL